MKLNFTQADLDYNLQKKAKYKNIIKDAEDRIKMIDIRIANLRKVLK